MKCRPIVIVFARAPTPGRAKTRLVPRLGAWRAARLHARLTLRALSTARKANLGQVELHATPRAAGAFFLYCKRKFGLSLSEQRGSDLGERMYRALSRTLRRHRAAILVGTDCPALRPSDLRRAARLLQGACDVVLAPAEDGGYALIGASRISRAPFEGIGWGKSGVYADTVRRLSQSGHRWRALRTLWDVDRPEDLDRLASSRQP
jgi:rSAM/selenodomain-associated transferase 1